VEKTGTGKILPIYSMMIAKAKKLKASHAEKANSMSYTPRSVKLSTQFELVEKKSGLPLE